MRSSRPAHAPSSSRELPFGERVVDSTGALALDRAPEHLVVVGAGYIGVELGTAWAKLGSHVALVERAGQILPELPLQLAQPVHARLAELGITVHLGRAAAGFGDGSVHLDDGSSLVANLTVVAVGRRPNGDTCEIEAAGASLAPTGHIVVDDELRAAPNVYAIGDVIDGPALAHRATADAERVAAHICGEPWVAPTVVPAVVFSDPEIMSAGVWPDPSGIESHSLHRFPHAASARARTLGATPGATYVVSDAAGTIVGMHAVGPHASELAGEAALAIEMATTVEELAWTVHAHPTMGESFAEAALIGLGRPLHVRR